MREQLWREQQKMGMRGQRGTLRISAGEVITLCFVFRGVADRVAHSPRQITADTDAARHK